MVDVISKYNHDKKSKSEVEALLKKDKRIKEVEGGFALVLNAPKKGQKINPDIIWNGIGLKMKSDINIKLGRNERSFKAGTTVTPFELFVEGLCKGNIMQAVYQLNARYNKKKPPYVRVGTDYYKVVTLVDRDGVSRVELKKWKKETLLEDYDRDIIDMIPCYDSFGMFPSNKNFKQVKDGVYNQYAPFSWKSFDGDVAEEDIPWSMRLIKHVFGKQWELGLVYMQVLYLYPKQILPIVGLVSEERGTGKSTFGDWLNILFGDNTCVINPSNISSSHNSSYATKNIIMIEETKFDKQSDLEKIKALATQKKMTINPKFVAEYSIPFYGKLVMFSNHEDKFVRIDAEENRYWVLKVPTLKGKANHGILKDLKAEVPKFLTYLEQLPEPDFSRSRMVFTQEEISTQILNQTKRNSRSGAYKDIVIHLETEMQENADKDYIYFRHEGLHKKYFGRNHRYSVSYIQEVLKDEMKLEMNHRTRERLIGDEGAPRGQKRAFRVKNKFYNPDIASNIDDVPF